MKKTFVTFSLLVSLTAMVAQTTSDALRYSLDGIHGTARFSGMSGAFGALGGDLSAISLNPASSAVFVRNSAGVSLSFNEMTSDLNYFNSFFDSNEHNIRLNQAGIVFVLDNYNDNSFWSKLSIGLNLDTKNNFKDDVFVSGTSPISIDSYFLGYANGFPLELLELQPNENISSLYQFLGQNYGFAAQQAFLGFQSFIIDPIDFNNPNNTSYSSNISGDSFYQRYQKNTSGHNTKATFNIGAQIKNNVYVGINLNSHIIDYKESSSFSEQNNDPNSTVTEMRFNNALAVTGSGFSAQVGAIAKLTESIRVGATYNTPTWTNINEETTQSISSIRVENNANITSTIRPNIINVYEEYQLKTPGKFTGSVAYLFDNVGLISVDYSYQDFSNMSFKSTFNNNFTTQNNALKNDLQAVTTLRIGGEYRFERNSFRGGLHFIDSPYKDKSKIDDASGFSLGYGYSFNNFRLDLAYSRTDQKMQQQLFEGSDFTNAFQRKNREHFVALTANFAF